MKQFSLKRFTKALLIVAAASAYPLLSYYLYVSSHRSFAGLYTLYFLAWVFFVTPVSTILACFIPKNRFFNTTEAIFLIVLTQLIWIVVYFISDNSYVYLDLSD